MRLRVNKKNKILFYFILFILFTTITNNNFYSIKNKLFKIDSIEIYGLKDKDKVQIIENLSYLFGTNLLFLDHEKISYDLEKLGYLIAKTFIDGNMFYLTSNGKFISKSNLNIPAIIPNVYGKFNPEDYFNLNEILKKNKFQINEITEYFYFESNRWDIKMRNNTIIKFPSTNLDQYIKIAKLLIKNNNEKKIIDLRVSNQVIITNE